MEWITVNKKSKSRIRHHDIGTISSNILVSYTSFRERIQACKSEYSKQQWVHTLSSLIKGKIIAVGLGNFSSSHYSISQQALYEYLLETNNSQGILYDPAYLPEELQYLEEKGYLVNIGGFEQEEVDICTYVMIHCHFSLYERLIASQWTSDAEIYFVGNSLEDIQEKFIDETARQKASKFKAIHIETTDLAFHQTYFNTKY